MPPHERNPICIKDSEHIAELIKLRFDASDARQETTSKLFTKELGEIKEQVVYTNGRTRKLEDYHLEQIAWNREQSAINKELLEFVVSQKQKDASMSVDYDTLIKRLSLILWIQKHWWAISAFVVSVAAIYVSTKTDKNEDVNKQYQQTNSSQHSKIDSSSDGYSDSNRKFVGPNTLFWIY